MLSLRERQPWKAAHERDYAWLGDAMTEHYHGDDTKLKVLMGGILRAFGGMSVEAYEQAAAEFLGGPHPTLDRSYRECGYVPMIELLALSRGQRVHVVHRLGRRPGLHATGHGRDLRDPRRARDRQLQRPQLPGG